MLYLFSKLKTDAGAANHMQMQKQQSQNAQGGESKANMNAQQN